ncbi:MAG: heme exporter protein CcmD [Oceanicaulis sp.]
MSAFFAMDGYAAFVWSSYGLTLLGIGGLVALTIAARRRARARLDRLERLEAEETGR